MEPAKQQKITQSRALKLSNKFLIPISFFFVILPIFLHYSKFQFQFFTSTSHLFSNNSDKNYMFLLCNGILALIAKNAGLMGSNKNQEDRSESPETKPSVAEETVGVKVDQEERHVEEMPLTAVNEAEHAEGEFKEQRNGFTLVDEDEEDGSGLDELNKKCDDFIRKMKEGIKLEEAQALITVYYL